MGDRGVVAEHMQCCAHLCVQIGKQCLRCGRTLQPIAELSVVVLELVHLVPEGLQLVLQILDLTPEAVVVLRYAAEAAVQAVVLGLELRFLPQQLFVALRQPAGVVEQVPVVVRQGGDTLFERQLGIALSLVGLGLPLLEVFPGNARQVVLNSERGNRLLLTSIAFMRSSLGCLVGFVSAGEPGRLRVMLSNGGLAGRKMLIQLRMSRLGGKLC